MAEGCYTPTYLPAAFKGVPFQAMETTSEYGRRGAEGEFPFGESTAYADLGRRIRTYNIRGRFAENDHVLRSNALIAACESIGPGAFLHPTRGIITVACKSVRVRDNPLEEQGVTYVDLELVEANIVGNGFNLGGLLQAGLSLAPLIAVLALSFNNRYRPNRSRTYQRRDVLNTASNAMLQLRDIYHAVAVSGAETDPNAWQVIFELEQNARRDAVLQDSDETFNVLKLGMAAISASTSGAEKYNSFLRLANENALTPNLSGVAAQSQEIIYTLMRTLSAGYMVRGALENTGINADTAFREYEQVSAILESEIAATRELCDNVLYMELRNFYVSARTALLNRVACFPCSRKQG